jgi:hypothetical protein
LLTQFGRSRGETQYGRGIVLFEARMAVLIGGDPAVL